MSRAAIAAALAREELPVGERLVAFSLASFADRDGRARPGTPAAAGRAGLKRSWFLEARQGLERRGLVVVDESATGRGRASTLWLAFVDAGPWWEGEINAELFEAVLGYSRSQGAARLLLAAAAALADERRVLECVTTRQLCAAAGLSGTTYRRARAWLLASGELVLRGGNGGRGKTNRWEISDPRAHAGESLLPVGRRRVPPPAGQRPLLGSVSSAATTAVQGRPGLEVDEVQASGEDRIVQVIKGAAGRTLSAQNRPAGGGGSHEKGAADRTLSGENRPPHGGVLGLKGAAGRTLSPKTPPETPPKTPPPNARAGSEPQNPRTLDPPSPPERGSVADRVLVEEAYVTERGRRRRRLVEVDVDAVRDGLRAAGREDRAAWEQIRELLLGAVGESRFELWLAALELIAVNPDGTLVVAVPELIGGWVRARFAPALVSAAQAAGRTARFATEVEQRAFASPPPAAGTEHEPAARAGSLAQRSPARCATPRTAASVGERAARSSDRRADRSAYPSSYPSVYNQVKEVS